MMMMMTCI